MKQPLGNPDDLPSQETLDAIDGIGVEDEEGKQRPFEGLIRHGKTLVVFIRHFGCSMCQDYITALQERITPQALEANGTKLIVVGCGHWSMAKDYKELLNCPYPIYAEATRKLYDELQMIRPTFLKHAPSDSNPTYSQGLVPATVASIGNLWKMGRFFSPGSMGHITQLGGEFLFQEGKCTWAHRMQHTRDHTPVAKVAELLGIP